MKLYHYHQSNPGGSLDRSKPLELYIQAPTPKVADAIAETYGVYFDGIRNGLDCECCNDRWDRASNYDLVDIEDIDIQRTGTVVHYVTELNKSLG